jgi:hypothetical protein
VSAGPVSALHRAVASAQVLITHPVRAGYHGQPLGTADLLERTDADCLVVTVPSIHHWGLFPFQDYVRIDGEAFYTAAPLTRYHDLRFLFCASNGWTTAQSVDWLRGYEPPAAAVRKLADYHDADLARRDQRVDVRIAGTALQRPQQPAGMYTFNHPSAVVLNAISTEIHTRLGLAPPPPASIDPLAWLKAPLERPILDALGLDAPPRPGWTIDGRHFPLVTVLEAHLPWYRAHPELVDVGIGQHADRMRLLGIE